MAKRFVNNIKLGAFTLAGLIFLVLLLYMIGKNKNLFGDTYVLKVRFKNVQGLVAGNNVRFSGIQSGTVKNINILNDTVIDVSMLLDKKMQNIIRKSAVVTIGTDGLVGNKVVNIVPNGLPPLPFAQEGDLLIAKNTASTDDILETLHKATIDVNGIATEIKTTMGRINNSKGLWGLLDDQSIPKDVRIAVANIRLATAKAGLMADNLNTIVLDVKDGKGSVGALLKDTAIAQNLNEAIAKIKSVGVETDSLVVEINKIVEGVRTDLNTGKGPANAILKDSMMVIKLNQALDNIQKGTDGFNQNMEALKHSFLTKGYFKKQEKQKQKELKEQEKLNQKKE
jgi:phospholipid/cholesterol/gamma-HCH transport system substrate-binding protein